MSSKPRARRMLIIKRIEVRESHDFQNQALSKGESPKGTLKGLRGASSTEALPFSSEMVPRSVRRESMSQLANEALNPTSNETRQGER